MRILLSSFRRRRRRRQLNHTGRSMANRQQQTKQKKKLIRIYFCAVCLYYFTFICLLKPVHAAKAVDEEKTEAILTVTTAKTTNTIYTYILIRRIYMYIIILHDRRSWLLSYLLYINCSLSLDWPYSTACDNRKIIHFHFFLFSSVHQ